MKSHPNITTIFSDGLKIFTKEWKLLVGITLIFMIPIYVALFWTQNNSVGLGIFFMLLFFLVAPILQIILVKITESRHKNKITHPWSELWSYVRIKYLDVLLTMILLGLVAIALMIAITIIFGIIAALIAGITGLTIQAGQQLPLGIIITGIIFGIIIVLAFITFATYIFFTNPIVVLTKHRYWSAIKESYKLVKGRWWQTFGRLLVLQLASLVLVYIVIMIFFPIELTVGITPTISLLKSTIQQIIVLPIGVAGIAWYLRLK
jgi:hypothetical protein